MRQKSAIFEPENEKKPYFLKMSHSCDIFLILICFHVLDKIVLAMELANDNSNFFGKWLGFANLKKTDFTKVQLRDLRRKGK